jgi:hypothetical protein
MSHIRYPASVFEQLFKDKTGIKDATLSFEKIDDIENPVITVDSKDFDKASKIMSEFHIEAKLQLK